MEGGHAVAAQSEFDETMTAPIARLGSPRAGHSCQNAKVSIGWSTAIATAAPIIVKPAFTSSARVPPGKDDETNAAGELTDVD